MFNRDWKIARKVHPRKNGHSIVEAVTAALILIPITLLILDLLVLVIANSMNDTAAKNAARAGANHSDSGAAFTAAQTTLNSFHSSPILKTLQIKAFDYPYQGDKVACTTRMIVNLPVPFPGFSTFTFEAKAVEPLVGEK